ncbi:MAG: LytTR family transcriptional regulator DNA-binding domain-containing protein [Coriobacteriia bacterium]|nr:LytTR family transcriptional regulator DNA-binding domain-containing protein [Coriobacteriia bacterium]
MKIVIEEPQDGEEEQIIVKCHELSPELLNVLNSLKTVDSKLIGTIDNKIFRVDPSDIYYIESVDNKTFLYGQSNVYESKQKLYELEEALAAKSFLRVSKSLIINLKKVESLAPALSGRLEAGLANGEKVTISRTYVNKLKDALGVGGGGKVNAN